MVTQDLSSDRAHALFVILSHHEAYQELRDLRVPGCLAHSGPPFRTQGQENLMPLLHALFARFIVPLPGLSDISTDFYQVRCQGIVEDLAKADLSESYDVGYIGIRKSLATAAAALIEAPARGYYGGLPQRELNRSDEAYDPTKPEDVEDAFADFLQKLVYGNLIDEVFQKAAETDKMEEHSPLLQAAHEYMLVIGASFLHYVLFISPEGGTMFTMMKRANALVPYLAIRQTLKIGNAASMINGMVRIVLTKMTMNSVTTFLGITSASDAGWNLLQSIIYAVVNWDTGDLKRRVTEIERSNDGPSKTQRQLLKSYTDKPREEREKCRTISIAKTEPIVVTIMDEYGGDALSEKQIPFALDYLSLQLSIRDRKMIISTLCSRHPDYLTHAVREAVAAYDHVIRALHKAVDLSATVGDFQAFLDDLLKFAPSHRNNQPPDIADIVQLLRKHQASVHRFIHQICKNGPDLSKWYRDYAKAAASSFRCTDRAANYGGAGKVTSALSEAFSNLPEKQQAEVLAECNAYASYLSDLSSSSRSSMKYDISHHQSTKDVNKGPPSPANEGEPSRRRPGPGMFLQHWQAYVSETSITPVHLTGPVRHGNDPEVVNASRVATLSSSKPSHTDTRKTSDVKPAPNSTRTVELLAGRFRKILRESGKAAVS